MSEFNPTSAPEPPYPEGIHPAIAAEQRAAGLDHPLALGVPGSPDGPPIQAEGTDPVSVAAQVREVLSQYPPDAGRGTRRGPRSDSESNDYAPHHRDPWTPQPETVAEQRANKTTQYTDRELLGRSYRVEQVVSETGVQAVRAFKGTWARIRNAGSLPNKYIKSFARNQAQKARTEKFVRLQTARAEYGDSSRVTKQHHDKFAKADVKYQKRHFKLKAHEEKMENRVLAVRNDVGERRQKYVSRLKERKTEALGRKAIRQTLRQTESRGDTRAIYERMNKDEFIRAGSVAIVQETSLRKLRQAEKVSNEVWSASDWIAKRAEKTESRALKHKGERNWHTSVARTLEQELSPDLSFGPTTLVEKISELQARLDGLDPADPSNANERRDIAAQLRVTRTEQARLRKDLRHHKKEAETYSRFAGRADKKSERLRDSQSEYQADIVTNGRELNIRRLREENDRAAAKEEVTNILKSDKTK